MIRYAHLHGFASSPASRKGTHLAQTLAGHGITLECLDLNRPSFSELTYTGALGAVDEAHATTPDARWRLTGSSMGGWVAARWAELHPEQVDRLVLLCPGLALLERWPVLLGDDGWAQWERDGYLPVESATGAQVPVGWQLIEDARTHPPIPEVPCPTLIIHGVHDVVVPVEGSRRYARDRDHVTLVEVDSDHGLISALPQITDLVLDFYGVSG